ncbi:MAG TPA: hypothetical protein VFW48_07045 [Solirubrobacterales bacterium]|nr:hypothetical protein [Solirubrobacterales bacterium]
MSVRARCFGALFLVVAVFAVPPTSPASPLDVPAAVPAKFRALVRGRLHRNPKPRSTWESSFRLGSRQGYDLAVFAVDGIVGIVVTRRGRSGPDAESPGRGTAVTGYVARGIVTPRRIKASFGRFGRIAVRFRPSGRVTKSASRRHCRGPDRYTNRFGVFVGNVRFTGEQGYVAVRAHRAKGRIRSPLRLRCSSRGFRASSPRYARPVRGGPSFPFSVLQAGHRKALAATEFLALQIGDRTLYLALTEKSLGSVAVVRYALAAAPSRSFVRNEALTSARLSPPAPFSRTGSYAAAPDGTKSWAGRLAVSFPGAPRVPLAGSQFWVDLESGL